MKNDTNRCTVYITENANKMYSITVIETVTPMWPRSLPRESASSAYVRQSCSSDVLHPTRWRATLQARACAAGKTRRACSHVTRHDNFRIHRSTSGFRRTRTLSQFHSSTAPSQTNRDVYIAYVTGDVSFWIYSAINDCNRWLCMNINNGIKLESVKTMTTT